MGYKMRVNAITCRGYNPSVKPTACQLPLHRGAEKRAQFALQSTGEPRRLSRKPQNFQRCVPQLSPPLAGCPHPSQCGAAPHRATFPKGKAMRSVCLVEHGGAEVCTLYTAPFAKAGNKKTGGAGLLL